MSDEKSKIKTPTNLGYILPLSLGIGVIFGFAMEKGRVFEPDVIVDQMLMKRFQMVKMFLSAVSSSVLAMIALSKIPATRPYFLHARSFIYSNSRPGILATTIGAMLLGAGMSLCGACPGTVAVQLGAGVLQAPFVVIGGIIAGGFFAKFVDSFRPLIAASPVKTKSVEGIFANQKYEAVALPLVGMLVTVVVALEYFFPWKQELGKVLTETTSVLAMEAWPPYLAGAIVGLLNIPAMLLLTVSLGSATSYQTVAVNLACCVQPQAVKKSNYLNAFLSPIAYWQPTYLTGAVLGACASAMLSGTFHSTPSMGLLGAFIGGFVLILGSRIGGGCTSGHGITGFSFLQTISFIAVPAMFAGGIASAFILRSIGFYS
eukprot:TRINITY_DN324_c0_g1_i1.p1 TRINITY_DN324_c0_g1~~TRINITY_DN324_c0_g1_i1.p1  ORF type:complete len:374 (-),score=51.47 TRINITY_DN324_c0_g1_i1:79-1200(-)